MIGAAIVELSSGARTAVWWTGAAAGVATACTVLAAAWRTLRTTRLARWFRRRFIAPIGAARQAERDARTLEAHRQLLAPMTEQIAAMRSENGEQHRAVWRSIEGMSGRLTAVEEALTTPERRAS